MHNPYRQAKFLLSTPTIRGCPDDDGHEVVFAGRSNAGKSSSINTLTEQKKLAKVSRTPGRTQHLVFFTVDEKHRLVDLPGYGYAKTPEKIRQDWHKNISLYINKRQSLRAVILVMDCRRPLTKFDQMMLNWCIDNDIKTHILLTKADKLKKGAASSALLKVKREVSSNSQISVQLFSSLKKQGLLELQLKLDELLQLNHVN